MTLGKPGDGLPLSEFKLIRYFFIPTVRTFLTWQIAMLMLKREVKIISKLTSALKADKLRQQPIIDKTFAIEDDSRRFSINMVIEHLTIAGRGIMGVIDSLSKERAFEKSITIESVKPFENRSDALKEFLSFIHEYERFYGSLDKKYSKTTKPHPWFGAFNNFDWHIFMYMHTFIHRRQIEEIIKVLKENR